MALILRKTDKLKEISSNDFIGEDGIYKVILKSNESKVWEFEGNRQGNKYHNIMIQFENGRTKYISVHYQTKDKENGGEGDIIPAGFNFLIALRNILETNYLDREKNIKRLDEINADTMIALLIKDEIPVYLAFRKSEWKGNTYFNLNDFFTPVGDLREAEEAGQKRKLQVINLEKEETKEEAVSTQTDDFDYDDFDEDDL